MASKEPSEGVTFMSILNLGGLARDKDRDKDSGKRLDRLLSTLEREQVSEVADKVMEGARSIGERHEFITSTIEDAVAALDALKSIESGLERARRAIDIEFDSRRDERSEIVALNALLENVREELATGGARELDLQTRLSGAEAALAEAKGARSEAEAAAVARQAEVVRLTTSFNGARSDVAELKTLLEQASRQLAQSQEDASGLRGRVDELESRRQDAEARATAVAQARSLVEAERGALERRAEAQSTELAQLGRAIAELEGRLAAEGARARGLESALQAAQSDVERISQAMEELNANTRVHLETANMRFDTSQARAARLEDENAEITRQLQDTTNRERSGDRELAEVRQRLERAEERTQALEADLTSMRQELLAADGARAAAVERGDRLNEALLGRTADVKRLTEEAEVMQNRLSAVDAELAGERASSGERARTLTDLIERERSEHSIAQGALEAARRDRARLHLELLKVSRRRPTPEELSGELPSVLIEEPEEVPFQVKAG
jgi:crescentin